MNFRIASILLFCFLSCFYFISCSCNSVECEEEESYIYFRILSNVDSTDLVFGDSIVYQIENLEVFKLEFSDTTFFNLSRINDLNGTNFLRLDHEDFGTSRMFINFGNSDIDTLDVGFSVFEASKCCDAIRELSTVSQNGNLVHNSMTNSFVVSLFK